MEESFKKEKCKRRSIIVGYNSFLLLEYNDETTDIDLYVYKRSDKTLLGSTSITKDMNSKDVVNELWYLEKVAIENFPKGYSDDPSDVENLSWDLGSFINSWLSLIDQTNNYEDVFETIDYIFAEN